MAVMKKVLSLAIVAAIVICSSQQSIAQTKNCGILKSGAQDAENKVTSAERKVDSIERQIERVITQTDRREDQLLVQVARAQELQKQLEQRADFNIATGIARFLFVSTRSVTSTLNNQSALRALAKRLENRERSIVNRIERLKATSNSTLRRYEQRLRTAQEELDRARTVYAAKQALYLACAGPEL